MGQYNTAVLTTAGQALLTSILGTNGTLTFSKFQTSSYQYASGTDLSALTSLQSVEQTVVPSAGGVKDATTFYSSSTVPNTGVTVEYTNYTVGLFATDGDDEVLFAVSTAIIPDIIPVDDGGTPSTYTYTMSIGVSSTDDITVEVDDQGILRVTSIVDNLNSTSATQPLSANMGRFLNDKVNYYGVCSTAAGTTAKTASTANGDFTLETGARIVIKFANGSTIDSPTLNIDSTGAKAIYLNGAALDMDFEAGGCYLFVYNGTQFDLLGGGGTVTTVNVSYIGATIDAAIPQGTIVYYLKQKLYKIARDLSGETFPYTIVPSTDFEASGLNGTELLLVDGIPGSGINALDVAFDNTGTGMSAGNVQNALAELNSNKQNVLTVDDISSSFAEARPGVTDFSVNGAVKYGKVISCHVDATVSGQYNTIAYVNQQYRPIVPVYCSATVQINGLNTPTYAVINTDGSIYVVNSAASDAHTWISATYVSA